MRLAIFDLDSTLVDRSSAVADAMDTLSHDHGYGPEIDTWLLTELAERAGFDRLRAAFPGHLSLAVKHTEACRCSRRGGGADFISG
ncbi:HAD family hydrolase [Streptomyces sp. NRRL S-340]|uniref:HAD family hydrolase n=1 Tax=Streptomyces sp. NRRL S-340 TaxID=1463901 RepID=UPI000A425866|nr:HAD family hydrolase [Streptomyces sp. NRRL S-340]